MPHLISRQVDALLLLVTVLAVSLWHIVPEIVDEYRRESVIRRYKEGFNRLVDEGEDKEMLKCLKILINNMESVENIEILKSKNKTILKNEISKIKIKHIRMWLWLTPCTYFIILGPLYCSILVYVIKSVKKV